MCMSIWIVLCISVWSNTDAVSYFEISILWASTSQIGPLSVTGPGIFVSFLQDDCVFDPLTFDSSLEALLDQICTHPTKNYLRYYSATPGFHTGQIGACPNLGYIQSRPLSTGDTNVLGNYFCDTGCWKKFLSSLRRALCCAVSHGALLFVYLLFLYLYYLSVIVLLSVPIFISFYCILLQSVIMDCILVHPWRRIVLQWLTKVRCWEPCKLWSISILRASRTCRDACRDR